MSTITDQDYTDFVRKLFNRQDDVSKDYAHAVLGVVTEIHEYLNAVDDVNALEELGDLEFFVEAFAQVVADITGERPDLSEDDLLAAAIEWEPLDRDLRPAIQKTLHDLTNTVKRWVGYGKQPADLPELWKTAAFVAFVANQIGSHPTTDRQQVRAANVRKLLKRYPDGEFSQMRALVRDVEAEREAIQGNT